MHFLENIFALAFDLDTDIGPQGLQIRGYLMEVFGDVSGVDYHHHVEIPLDDGLGYVHTLAMMPTVSLPTTVIMLLFMSEELL